MSQDFLSDIGDNQYQNSSSIFSKASKISYVGILLICQYLDQVPSLGWPCSQKFQLQGPTPSWVSPPYPIENYRKGILDYMWVIILPQNIPQKPMSSSGAETIVLHCIRSTEHEVFIKHDSYGLWMTEMGFTSSFNFCNIWTHPVAIVNNLPIFHCWTSSEKVLYFWRSFVGISKESPL